MVEKVTNIYYITYLQGTLA